MGRPANHLVVTGKGIQAVLDIGGLGSRPVVSLSVDGFALDSGAMLTTPYGVEVTALVHAVPDSHTTHLRLVVPQVCLEEEPETATGVALLATGRTSIGGPCGLVGPMHVYEVRPVAVTARVVET
jgi:hypothetical protein